MFLYHLKHDSRHHISLCGENVEYSTWSCWGWRVRLPIGTETFRNENFLYFSDKYSNTNTVPNNNTMIHSIANNSFYCYFIVIQQHLLLLKQYQNNKMHGLRSRFVREKIDFCIFTILNNLYCKCSFTIHCLVHIHKIY